MNGTAVFWVITGVALALGGQKAWAWLDSALDRWLDGVTIAFVPDDKAQELEQYLWGKG